MGPPRILRLAGKGRARGRWELFYSFGARLGGGRTFDSWGFEMGPWGRAAACFRLREEPTS